MVMMSTLRPQCERYLRKRELITMVVEWSANSGSRRCDSILSHAAYLETMYRAITTSQLVHRSSRTLLIHKSNRTQSSRTVVKSYPCLGGQLELIVTATCTVYMTIYSLHCLTAISAFSKHDFGICCHLLRIQTNQSINQSINRSWFLAWLK